MSQATRVFEKMVNDALSRSVCCPGDRTRIWQEKMARGENPPMTEDMKPGYLLRHLSEDERKSLSELTSEEVALRALRPEWMPLW